MSFKFPIFKKGVFKVNDPKLRHDEKYVVDMFKEILQKHDKIITFMEYQLDYDPDHTLDNKPHIGTGLHINMTFKSTSYKTLLKLYTNDNPDKDKRCYWYMKDLPNIDAFIAWDYYKKERNLDNYWRGYRTITPKEAHQYVQF